MCTAIQIFHQFRCHTDATETESAADGDGKELEAQDDSEYDDVKFYFGFFIKFVIVALFHWNYKVM